MSDYALEFLFIAETFNGQVIKQPPSDLPRFSDKGSAFTDVLKEKIKRFSLVGKGQIFTVDLVDGHMEANGNTIYPAELPPIPKRLDLIYYRQVQRRLAIGPDGLKFKPIVRYYLGWKTTHLGRNYSWVMGVD